MASKGRRKDELSAKLRLMELLKGSSLSDKSKELLVSRAEVYLHLIDGLKWGQPKSKDVAALKLSCDSFGCGLNPIRPAGVGRQQEKLSLRLMTEARRVCGVPLVLSAEPRIRAMIELLKHQKIIDEEGARAIEATATCLIKDFDSRVGVNGVRVGVSPYCIAYGALWLASILSNYRIMQREIADCFNTTPPSIRSGAKRIQDVTGVEVYV